MIDNPYHSPQAPGRDEQPSYHKLSFAIVLAIILAFGLGGLLEFGCVILSMRSPAARSLSEFLMPRFGWNGLFSVINPLIFLAIWLKQRRPLLLLTSAGMFLVVAVIQARQLVRVGTVAVVENPFHDRLHSSWMWTVGSYAAMAALLTWLWWIQPRTAKQGLEA